MLLQLLLSVIADNSLFVRGKCSCKKLLIIDRFTLEYSLFSGFALFLYKLRLIFLL